MTQGSPDIRQQVDANRGIAKKLELLIPGLRGYRSKEDIRVSDELLRNQVADRLDKVRDNLQQLRKQVASSGDFTNLTSVGSVISQVQALSGEVRHAGQGYAGWAAPIQVTDDKLNKLYDYDYSFVSAVFQLDDATSSGRLVYDSAAPSSIQAAIGGFVRDVADIKQKWSQRIEAIEGIALGQ
ncbi:MAG: hypothetical protein JRM76_00700 [Nitrososphaerota archaeon]|nr:hypothetical protein [Nitrososphaerota archaeon]MDG6903295.1 hypothetical protein [Nitrososphaerota archaeon]MDG6911844.1 hypothetical protein [Nitrososphaerota archaeon]MDG6940675.1 hypothetical protein [Nitrososphaerota archaeon]MDG6963141.1 hypothetical protein [Nitrososphaerota archaeon]